jgi:hypothetical protein
METSNVKRSRVSPRTNAFNSVLALIDAQMKDECDLQPATAALTYLRQQVQTLIGTKHQVVKATTTKKPRTPKAPKIQGTHFVAETMDSKTHYVKGKDVPTWIENDPTVVFFGPYNTKAGALFAIESDTYHQKPAPYGKPV